jgi:hypothetical protein
VNNQKPITYGQLAERLGLKFAKQEWTNLLDLIAGKTKRDLGDDYDLAWNVVYGKGNKAEGLSRYFSEGDKAPGTTVSNLLERTRARIVRPACATNQIDFWTNY